jgi:hypothetical protein
MRNCCELRCTAALYGSDALLLTTADIIASPVSYAAF